jgi:hypothetical protein
LKKSLRPQPLTRSEKRAAALDGWVKRHVAESREADTAKKSRLKELRLAREALQKEPAASSEHVDWRTTSDTGHRGCHEAPMIQTTQQYSVGDQVHVAIGSLSGPATTGPFEIMGFYRVESYEPMYRLLSIQDRAERVVPQSELRSIAGVRISR